jgi:hypothetical protein
MNEGNRPGSSDAIDIGSRRAAVLPGKHRLEEVVIADAVRGAAAARALPLP